MKRTLLVFVASLFTIALAADHGYNPQGGGPGNWGGQNASTHSVKIRNGRLYVNNSIHGTDSFLVLSNSLGANSSLAVVLTRDGVSSTHDLTSQLAALSESGSNVLHSGVTFQRGDVLQFVTVPGESAYGIAGVGKFNKPKFNAAYGRKHYFEISNPYGSGSGALDFIFVTAGNGSAGGGGSTGQPLPGVAATLIAGYAGYCLRRRSLRNKR